MRGVLVGGFCLKKRTANLREFFRSHNRIFLASGLKFAYRKFFHALTGKMLASGFVYHTHPLLCTPHFPIHPPILITAPWGGAACGGRGARAAGSKLKHDRRACVRVSSASSVSGDKKPTDQNNHHKTTKTESRCTSQAGHHSAFPAREVMSFP